ncbi:hypothetical protein D3C71_1720820 [compost metagenome]
MGANHRLAWASSIQEASRMAAIKATLTSSARLGDSRHKARQASSTGRAENTAFQAAAGRWYEMPSRAACSRLAMISTPDMPARSCETGVG